MTIDWDYNSKNVNISMPGYVDKALDRFQPNTFGRSQHSPHAWAKPQYGSHPQLPPPPDDTDLLPPSSLTCIQEVVDTLLFYGRAIDSTMLVTLGTITSQQSEGTHAPRPRQRPLRICSTTPQPIQTPHSDITPATCTCTYTSMRPICPKHLLEAAQVAFSFSAHAPPTPPSHQRHQRQPSPHHP
jgi:hypothetical protein